MKKRRLFLLAVILLLLAGSLKGEGQAATREFARGSWDGNVFTSEFAGLRFTMPNNWLAGSDEEIAALMGVSLDFLSERGMRFSERILELTNIYDMMVQNPFNGDSVALMYENLSMHIGGSQITETLYLEILREQLNSLGIGYTFSDITETVIAGETFKTLEAALPDFGFSQFYHARRIDSFICLIIVTIDFGNDDMISSFSGL